MKYQSQEELENYKKSLRDQGFFTLETTISLPEMCECGRLYKGRRDENGKEICAACFSNCSIEDLKKIWGTTNKWTG